ncbi:alpha/beta hydrolase [Almyronema epifaneia]|uniref:Alpha/beta hydrolase n=1 Tax=Almyronema epifaneia S1 TaxID=2991925 RepID=A0ABW6IBC7_9CYAN
MLPANLNQLTEPASTALAQQIQLAEIKTPLTPAPIATAYTHQGAGAPPLLLLAGFDSSLLEFRRLIPRLASEYSTWAVDMLGFGFTDRVAGVNFSPGAIKLHLYSTWQQLIQRPVVLIGASMGGAAAIDFALTYPDCVEKLILLDSAGFAAGPAMGQLMFPPLDRWATNFLKNPAVRRRISWQAYCDRNLVTPDAELCAALHTQLPNWHEALIAFTKSGGYNFLTAKIAQIAVPTLIVWGQQDRILGIKDATRFQQAIASSQLVWIADCGHVPHLEKPELTAEAILRFVG